MASKIEAAAKDFEQLWHSDPRSPATRRKTPRQRDRDWTREMEEALGERQPFCVVCGSRADLKTEPVRVLSDCRPGNVVRLCLACFSKKGIKDLSASQSEMARRIRAAAKEFKQYWDARQATQQVQGQCGPIPLPSRPEYVYHHYWHTPEQGESYWSTRRHLIVRRTARTVFALKEGEWRPDLGPTEAATDPRRERSGVLLTDTIALDRLALERGESVLHGGGRKPRHFTLDPNPPTRD
jgi:hypothetical protein